jgi:hypothetical protein
MDSTFATVIAIAEDATLGVNPGIPATVPTSIEPDTSSPNRYLCPVGSRFSNAP